jgi:hypothetical protein
MCLKGHLEERKTTGTLEIFVPVEREGTNAFGMEETERNFPMETQRNLYFGGIKK